MKDAIKCKAPKYYDITCSYCASIISFGLEDTDHYDVAGETVYRYIRCPNCKRKCITHTAEGQSIVLKKTVEPIY